MQQSVWDEGLWTKFSHANWPPNPTDMLNQAKIRCKFATNFGRPVFALVVKI
jgi:hypothetical protein